MHWQSIASFDVIEELNHDGFKSGLKFISILKVYQIFTHYLS